MTGPIFVCGRQHSGNTVTAYIFGQVPECYSANVEGLFFEHRAMIERVKGPERRATRVADLLRLEDEGLVERTRPWLVEWHRAHPEASAVEVYRQAMDHVTALAGKTFWVRRATSYIFYAEDILTMMPDARVVYLVRNPYDITASRKRRDPSSDIVWASTIGWNRGLRIATRLRDAHPDRMLIVRYEDTALEPLETFRGIFEFTGVPFRESYLDVPHINRSEAHQTRQSETRGMVASRVYYYRQVLTPAEVAAVDAVAWRPRVDELYPDLPHRAARPALGTRLRALGILLVSPLRYAATQLGLLVRRDPVWRVRRMLRRLRAAR